MTGVQTCALPIYIDRMVAAAGEAAVQTVDNLDATARFSEQLVYYLVPLILLIAVVISVWLGRVISIPLRATVNQRSAMRSAELRVGTDVRSRTMLVVIQVYVPVVDVIWMRR